MSDSFLVLSFYLGLIIMAGIKGLPKNPIDNFLAHISSQFQKRQQHIKVENRQSIVKLAVDNNLPISH